MLTADLARSWRRGNRTGPFYIDATNPDYLQIAEDLIAIVRQHQGRRRIELDQALQEYVGVGTDYRILRGLIKLLMDRCVVETAGTADPAEIRRVLFLKARSYHPVTDGELIRQRVIAEVAEELKCAPEIVVDGMYADLPENQQLIDFHAPTPGELVDEYNLAQAQALLYRCVEMRLWVERQSPAGYRQLFDAIKAYRLIHTVRGQPATGYEIRLDGPVSMFHRSQKYGVQMAVFLPALLLCQGWRMRAEIASKSRGSAFFELDSRQHRLRSHYVDEGSQENPWAAKLAASWTQREAEWRLEPCQEIIGVGESAFIPDFVVRHPEGRQVYLEILGFWTPRYLSDRLKELEHWGIKNFLFAVSDELRASREPPPQLPANVIVFKSSLDPRIILAAIDSLTH
jgi:hypothetical protein